MVSGGKISEGEEKLLEASEEMRTLTVGRRKAEVQERRVPDSARVGVDREAVSGGQSSECEAT